MLKKKHHYLGLNLLKLVLIINEIYNIKLRLQINVQESSKLKL